MLNDKNPSLNKSSINSNAAVELPLSTGSPPLNDEMHIVIREESLNNNESLLSPSFIPLENIVDGDLTTAQGVKELLKISIPIMASYTFSFSIVAISIFSGHLNHDKDHIAATTFMTLLPNALVMIALTPFMPITLLQSKAHGEWTFLKKQLSQDTLHNREAIHHRFQEKTVEMADYTKNGLVMSLSASIVPTLILAYSKPFLDKALGQDKDIAIIAANFLQAYALAVPALAWRIIIDPAILVCRHEKIAATIGLIDFSLALGASYLLCFGPGKIPKMGLKGLAVSFMAESYITAILYSLVAAYHKDLRPFQFLRHWRFKHQDWERVKDITRIALPMFVTVANEMGAQLAMNSLIGRVGTTALAAQNFMAQFVFLTYIPSIALGIAAGQQFARALGDKRYQDANRYAKSGVWTAVLLILPLVIAVSFYPEMLEFLLTNNRHDKRVSHILHGIAPISSVGVLFDAVGFVMFQDLRAIGDNTMPTVLSATNMWAGVLAGYLLGVEGGLGVYGIVAGYSAGLFGRMASLYCRWKKCTTPEHLQTFNDNINPPPPQKGFFQSLKDRGASFFCCCRKKSTNEQLFENLLGVNSDRDPNEPPDPLKKRSLPYSLVCRDNTLPIISNKTFDPLIPKSKPSRIRTNSYDFSHQRPSEIKNQSRPTRKHAPTLVNLSPKGNNNNRQPLLSVNHSFFDAPRPQRNNSISDMSTPSPNNEPNDQSTYEMMIGKRSI